MELILLLTMIAFLSQHSSADYIKTSKSGIWTDIRNECTLATPTITYSASELTVENNPDIHLAEYEKVWVGYTENMEIFRFYGCIHEDNVVSASALELQAKLGLCYSACPTARYFGVRVNGMNKTVCHCIKNIRQMDWTSCNASDDNGFAFGKLEYLALYKRVSMGLSSELKRIDTWGNMTNSCLRASNPKSSQVQWTPCSSFYAVLCADSQKIFEYSQTYLSWKKAADQCFDMQKYPVQFQSGKAFDSVYQFWLANIRSSTITKDEGQTTPNYTKYGYIMKEKSKLILRFEKQGGDLQGLCIQNTTVFHQTVDNSSNGLNTTAFHQTVDSSSSGLIGVYVGVTVVIVLMAIVFGAVILFKRKRRASPGKINNTRKNLTYESNTKVNHDLNGHRPEGAEVYHEIQDITESTNEEYDTIPDGYLQKSTQNNNNDVAYFVLEKHDNADYEFAKQVTGETEHEYDEKPINTVMATTDDYDHIGKGNSVLKQSLGDQPYDTTSSVKQKYQDHTYDHTGDHTTYNHTWKHQGMDTGDHSAYDHTGYSADYDHTGDRNSYDHKEDDANYDHTGDQTNYDHAGDDSA